MYEGLVREAPTMKLVNHKLEHDLTKHFTAVVFSKNRPLQLYALLESLFLNSSLPQECVNVLYKADHEYIWPMEQLKQAFPKVVFHPEYDFKGQTKGLVAAANENVMFFTDDDVFKDKTDFNFLVGFLSANTNIMCFSLRLGKHLSYCYSTQQSQNVPQGTTKEPVFVWGWKGTDWDWNYPLSVDGHIFRKHEILAILDAAGDWKSPNTFEGNMSHLHGQLGPPYMACFTTSKVFNIPHNRVQNEVQNVHGGGSENDLLSTWNTNKKIDIKTFQGLKNKSAHELVPLSFVERT